MQGRPVSLKWIAGTRAYRVVATDDFSGPAGVLATACMHMAIRRNTGSPNR